MEANGILHAYCPACARPRPHTVMDAGSCRCTECGRIELMMVPLHATEPLVAMEKATHESDRETVAQA